MILRANKNWFERDQDGWRRHNAKKPAYQLVRKIVGNLLDCVHLERLVIETSGTQDTAYIMMEGFGHFDHWDGVDPRDPRTFFPSGQIDDPRMHGHLGKGLKEFVSVMDSCRIEAGGLQVLISHVDNEVPELQMDQGGDFSVFRITGESSVWGPRDISNIEAFLEMITDRRLELPAISRTRGSGTLLGDFKKALGSVTYDMDDDIELRPTVPAVNVRIHISGSDEGWIYHRGIPQEQVMETDTIIDVSHRIPLTEKGDIEPQWKRNLTAQVLAEMIEWTKRSSPGL